MFLFRKSAFLLALSLLVALESHSSLSEIDYKKIFGDSYNSDLMKSRELIHAPIIIMGNKESPIKVHVNAFIELIDIETKPLISLLKKRVTEEFYSQLSKLKSGEFINIEDLPKGIDLYINHNLTVVISLSSDRLKPIAPSLHNKKAFHRKPINSNIFSTVHDINASVLQLDGKNTPLVNIDSSFRFNRVIISGDSSLKDNKTTLLKENWIAKYENSNESYFYGNINNPIFANVNSKKIKQGLAIGNTDVRQGVHFDSDVRYIDLDYAANVKTYIDNVLHEDSSLAAGRHRLNIPIQDNLFHVRVEVLDVHGRKKNYDFSSIGSGVESIPRKNMPIYFASIGKNIDNTNQLYTGIELGLDNLSKIQLALSHIKNKDSIAAQYYRALPTGSIKNTLTIDNVLGKKGYGLKTIALFKYNQKTHYALTHNYQQDLIESNEHFVKLDFGRKFNQYISARSSIEYNFLHKDVHYSSSAKYQFNDELEVSITHDKYENQDKNSSINLTYRFGNIPATISSKYRSNSNKLTNTARYDLSPDSYVSFEQNDTGKMLDYYLRDDTFNSKLKVNNKINGQREYKAEIDFSIVTSNDSMAMSRTIGNYYGFAIFETSDNFIGDMELKIDSSKCRIDKSNNCILLIHPEYDKKVIYSLENMPLGVIILPKDLSIMTPIRGGVAHLIESKKLYFVEGILRSDNKPLAFIMGDITNEERGKILSFSDDTGLFINQLHQGDYVYDVPGYKPYKFTVSKSHVKDGFINIGSITLKSK